MNYKCSNGRSLIISDKQSFDKDLGLNIVPYVVLLTSWNIKTASIENISDMIKLLIDKGTNNFLCLGEFAEQLHDSIDEIIYSYYRKYKPSKNINIITTYYDNEDELDDAINYYIYGTELPKEQNNCLLAILDLQISEDHCVQNNLKKTLLHK